MTHSGSVYLQLGAVIFLLGVGGRWPHAAASHRFRSIWCRPVLSSFDIPALSGDFIEFAAGLRVILLLFLIGLEYTVDELAERMRHSMRAGLLDILLNFPPGLLLGLALGWDVKAAVLLGGVTYVTSSAIVVKALADLSRTRCPETPTVVALLLGEDLAMTMFLPLAATLVVGARAREPRLRPDRPCGAVAALIGALHFGDPLGRIVHHRSEEIALLSALGLVLMVAGLAEELQLPAAVGAFLIGIALSDEVAHRTRTLLAPIRDVNVALFFLFFALQIDTCELPGVALPALGLALVTAATKAITGWRVAALAGVDEQAALAPLWR